jgi:hypothetical protein
MSQADPSPRYWGSRRRSVGSECSTPHRPSKAHVAEAPRGESNPRRARESFLAVLDERLRVRRYRALAESLTAPIVERSQAQECRKSPMRSTEPALIRRVATEAQRRRTKGAEQRKQFRRGLTSCTAAARSQTVAGLTEFVEADHLDEPVLHQMVERSCRSRSGGSSPCRRPNRHARSTASDVAVRRGVGQNGGWRG